jgi:hypothetical protein
MTIHCFCVVRKFQLEASPQVNFSLYRTAEAAKRIAVDESSSSAASPLWTIWHEISECRHSTSAIVSFIDPIAISLLHLRMTKSNTSPRVGIIGSGYLSHKSRLILESVAGLCQAIQLKRKLGHTNYTIWEQESSLGGTWYCSVRMMLTIQDRQHISRMCL